MTQVGSVYGQALYDLAGSENCTDTVMEQLLALRSSFAQEPDFLRLLAAPNIPKEERCQVLEESFGRKLHPYVLNFLKLLTEKGHIRQFFDCCAVYKETYYANQGILEVTAVTAVPLTGEQAQRLETKLKTMTGKRIVLENRVDPDCLGGVRLDYDGLRVDDTVARRLEQIRTLLKNTVL